MAIINLDASLAPSLASARTREKTQRSPVLSITRNWLRIFTKFHTCSIFDATGARALPKQEKQDIDYK
jgi:hypothetical protein